MKKVEILYALIGCFIYSATAQPQQFNHTWFTSGDHGIYKFIENKDSTYFLVGWSDIFMNGSPGPAYVMHVDKYGDTIWTKKYTNAVFFGLASNDDSSFVMPGGFTGSSGAASGLVKLNFSGDTLETRLYYDSFGCGGAPFSLYECSDKGYILENNGACDYGYLKVDSNLNVQWHQWQSMLFGCWKIRPDPLGGYVAVGNGGTNWPYAVERLDSAGNQVWAQNHGTMVSNPSNLYYASDVVVTPDSNYLVGTAGIDWQLIKLSRLTGDTMWTIPNDTQNHVILSMDYAGNDTYICAGGKLFLIDTAGTILWEHDYVLPGHQVFNVHVTKTLDGGFALAGSFRHFGPNYRIIFFIKTDSLGNTVSTGYYDVQGSQLVVYPNPAHDYLYLSTGTFANARDVTFTLYDMQGTIKMQEYYKGSHVNISHIPAGMYIAAVSGNGKTIRTKVVVRR